eukprot:2894657-Rhodomonas_salina.4
MRATAPSHPTCPSRAQSSPAHRIPHAYLISADRRSQYRTSRIKRLSLYRTSHSKRRVQYQISYSKRLAEYRRWHSECVGR